MRDTVSKDCTPALQGPVQKALSQMMALCSRRECCIQEIRAKLSRRSAPGTSRSGDVASRIGASGASRTGDVASRVGASGASRTGDVASRIGASGASGHGRGASEALSQEQIEEIIRRLVSEKFIDERRYASAFARDRSVLQGWGASRIRRALSLKGLSADDIAAALASVDASAAASRMESLLCAKLRSLRGRASFGCVAAEADSACASSGRASSARVAADADSAASAASQAIRVKLLRYGLSRGYTYDQVMDFLEKNKV